MKIEKITYQQTFPTGQYQNIKLGMEIAMSVEVDFENWERPMSEAAEEAFEYARGICESTFKKLNPHVGEVHDTVTMSWEVPVPNGVEVSPSIDPKGKKRLDSIEDQIMSCTEKKVLESYKFIARTNEKLQEAYDKKMEEFV